MQIGPSCRHRVGRFMFLLFIACFVFQPRLGFAEDFNADLYAQLLMEHSRETNTLPGTLVDYKGLKNEERWSELLKNLQSTKPSTLDSSAEKKAYWLNAYNILAIDTVLQSYPIQSIRDAGSLFSPVWEKEGIEIEGKPMSLSEIEHQILRPMGDPRVHAGIVCASRSCPSLLREPWAADTLEAQLDQAMRTWLAAEKKGLHIDRPTKKVRISRIFNWFSDDFAGREGILLILMEYAPPETSVWLRKNRHDVSLHYFRYDWDLNE